MRWPFQEALALNSFTTFERTVQLWESWMLRPGRRRLVGMVGVWLVMNVPKGSTRL
jgi:hypothetical protein